MPRTSSLIALAALLAAVAAPACNSLTGADSLKSGLFDDPEDDSSSGGDTTSTGPAPVPLVEVPGVTITEIAIYQGVKRPLMANGAMVTSNIPIVSGRDALIRVFVTIDEGFDTKQSVTARLKLGAEGTPIDVVQSLFGPSTESDLASTINFEVPGANIHDDFQYSVLVGRETGDPGTGSATWPGLGLEVVGGQTNGAALKIQLVPVQYDADGSGRLPDTSEAQIQVYKDAFTAMYPVASVEISLHAPFPYSKSVSAGGNGWGPLLDTITQLRLDDGMTDTYYYGIFTPKDSFSQFCQGGCVVGLGNLGGPNDNYSRAAIGVGFSGESSAETALHEIGHTHGRQHAPCDTGDADPQYPYGDGGIGVWGYNLVTKKLYAPNQFTDIMGYCEPAWISDFTFNALFQRVKAVNNAKVHYPAELLDRTYDRLRINDDGSVEWLAPITMHTPPMAEATSVVIETAAGEETVVGQLYARDHIAGGMLLIPPEHAAIEAVRLQAEGRSLRIER